MSTANENQPQEALQVNITYEEWVEMAANLSSLAYEIEDLKETIETLKVPDPNETAADAEKRLADLKEAEEHLAGLEKQYDEVLDNFNTVEQPDDPDADDYDEGCQFDFGESAADW